MPRKPLDSEHETVTCTVRLRIGTRNALDEKRGKIPRSAYLRHIVERALSEDPEAPRLITYTAAEVMEEGLKRPKVYDPHQEIVVEEKPKPVPKVKIIPTKEHRHVYANKSELPIRSQMRGRLQMQVYAYRCECGDIREGI